MGRGVKSVKPTLKKKLAEPKSAVKVVPRKDMTTRVVDNMNATNRAEWIKSGNIARNAARSVNTGKPRTTVKINTDPTKPKGVFGPLKTKIAAKSAPSASRTRSGAKRATGRKGQ